MLFLFRFCLQAIVLAAALATSSLTAAAHDWYPQECCHFNDCAPVDRVEQSGPGGMTVTSRHGTAVVPESMPRRESRDQRMHVCMQPGRGGSMRVICVFIPPLI